uniref:Glucosamine/galactosamine-6-phosphate isomerase domain-containing protein n=1 Tax=Calcidiscus leptoporus TaxID=127549 RepID=A0A7S0J8R2_9EUKA|mmetsp:Transcript_45004/g.105141  ORF Transcript_45004/g.105141 Transcript_45004/m.105141 type:complete len:446 (+) Transcript_45004:115-1452(+)
MVGVVTAAIATVAVTFPVCAPPAVCGRQRSFGLLDLGSSRRARRPLLCTRAIEPLPPPGFVWADATEARSTVHVEPDAAAVSRALCAKLVDTYRAAVASKGSFSFAISSGSTLDMLSALRNDVRVDWSKCFMGFVSSRCLPLDGEGAAVKEATAAATASATTATSMLHGTRDALLDSWKARGLHLISPNLHAISPLGSSNAEEQASVYENQLRASLPESENGYPMFDLCVVGMDHDGILHPNVAENRCVVPIANGTDGMGWVSLSIATLCASQCCVVACAGELEEAPFSSAKAVARALEAFETPSSFPASALRHTATWVLDAAAAALLVRSGSSPSQAGLLSLQQLLGLSDSEWSRSVLRAPVILGCLSSSEARRGWPSLQALQLRFSYTNDELKAIFLGLPQIIAEDFDDDVMPSLAAIQARLAISDSQLKQFFVEWPICLRYI